MAFVYLIQPYTASPQAAYEFTLSLLARESLYDSSSTLFSTILHYHETARIHGLPEHFRFWIKHNLNYLDRASEVRVVCADNYLSSIGCTFELEYARRIKLPTRFYSLDSAYHDWCGERFQRLNLYDCEQASYSYERLTDELQTELRSRRAREDSSKLA